MAPDDSTRVGIIGAGRIGTAMARIASRAGRSVVIANRHGPESLAAVVPELGDRVSAGTVAEAAAADVVVLAVMWPDVPGGRRRDRLGRADRHRPHQRLRPERPRRPHVERGRRRPRRARARGEDGEHPGGPAARRRLAQAGGERTLFLSGDDADAKTAVGALLEAAGFFVVDLGGLREGGRLHQFGGPLAGHNLIRLS